MKILETLIEKMDDTLDEIDFYVEKAHHLRQDHKSLADTYIKVGDMHIDIYKMLHDKVVELIDEEKRKGVAPPPEMMAIWNYEHQRLIKEFNEAKFLVEDYKKSY